MDSCVHANNTILFSSDDSVGITDITHIFFVLCPLSNFLIKQDVSEADSV